MVTSRLNIGVALVVAVLSVACASPKQDRAGSGASAPTTSATPIEAVEVDCTNPQTCPAIEVDGDPPAVLPSGAPSPLRGYADPSVRQDPESDRLWMAYSWPSLHVDGDARMSRVETHLAESSDGGGTWNYVMPLWEAEPATDPATGDDGFTDHEVANLVRQESPDGVRWIGARLDLFVPAGGSLGVRPPSSFRIVLTSAASPPELADAPTIALGAAATHPGWGTTLDLTKLDDEITNCSMWNEPALVAERDVLYLALRCLRFDPSTRAPDWEASELFVFRADTAGDIADWDWSYAGRLAGRDEALELGGDGLTQIDLAYDSDGALIALLTPDGWDPKSRDFVHHGLRVVEVASLAQPALARTPDGKLVVRAVVTADDGPLGPGASTYDPAVEQGIMLVRRSIGAASLVGSLHTTGVHP